MAPELPALAHQMLYRLKNDDLIIRTRDQEIDRLREQLEQSNRQTRRLMGGLGLIVLALVLAPAGLPRDASLVSWLMGFAGLVLIGMSWFDRG